MGLVQVKVTGVGTNPVALHMVPKPMTVTQGQTVEGEMDEANVATLEKYGEELVKIERGASHKKSAKDEDEDEATTKHAAMAKPAQPTSKR